MATVSLVQGNGKGRVSLDRVFQSFRSGLQGDVLLPGSGGYDAARALWDRHHSTSARERSRAARVERTWCAA